MQWFVVLPALADLIKRQRVLTIATEQAFECRQQLPS